MQYYVLRRHHFSWWSYPFEALQSIIRHLIDHMQQEPDALDKHYLDQVSVDDQNMSIV